MDKGLESRLFPSLWLSTCWAVQPHPPISPSPAPGNPPSASVTIAAPALGSNWKKPKFGRNCRFVKACCRKDTLRARKPRARTGRGPQRVLRFRTVVIYVRGRSAAAAIEARNFAPRRSLDRVLSADGRRTGESVRTSGAWAEAAPNKKPRSFRSGARFATELRVRSERADDMQAAVEAVGVVLERRRRLGPARPASSDATTRRSRRGRNRGS